MDRELSFKILLDTKYYDLFVKYCAPPCYMDEHYLPTLVHVLYGNMTANRSVTWVDWSKGGPHPRNHDQQIVTYELLNRTRFGSECVYNGNVSTNLCFLFARKFKPNSLKRLLRMATDVLGFDR